MAKKEESKEVAVKNSAPPSVVYDMGEDWAEGLSRAESTDLVIPRLTLIQPTSKIPGSAGDLFDSETNAVSVKAGEPFRFVPVMFFRDIAISDKATGKWKRTENKHMGNAHLTTYENRIGNDDDGKQVERKERVNLFVIREEDLAAGSPIVYRIIVKAASFKEIKKFITAWELSIQLRQPPFTKVWELTTKVIADEKGKYAHFIFNKVMDGAVQKQVTPEDFAGVKRWVDTLKSRKEELVRGGVEEESGPQSAPTHEI